MQTTNKRRYARPNEICTFRCSNKQLGFFLDFRQRITESYNQLFTERTEGDDEFQHYSERQQFGRNWGWYSSFYCLAQKDVTKLDEVAKLRLTKCLTYLTFEKQKNEIEANELKQQMKR